MTVAEIEALLARHHYAIIDRGMLADESIVDGLPVKPLVSYHVRKYADETPWLLPLEPAHMERLTDHLKAVEEGWETRMFSCLLAAPEVEPEALAPHLANRLALHGPRGSIDMLRYYDPRVFRHLGRILPPERLRTLYGPVTEWTIHLEGKWITLPAPEVTGPIPMLWGVKEPQYAQLDRIIHLNGILDRRKQQLGRPWRDLDDYHEAGRAADKALDLAQNRYRLSENDSASFVLDALAHGERFHLHPVIQRLLQAARNKEMPYTVSARKIDAQGWASIEAESFRLYE